MKIILISDSHGNVHNMEKALINNKDADMIIHLGDCVNDILRLQSMYGNYLYEFVRGNNDWSVVYPVEKTLDIEGRKIFITHGHNYNVKYNYQRIVARGMEIAADAVFFGHTHHSEEFFHENMLVLNPGSIGRVSPNSDRPTYCMIEISKGRITTRFQAC